MTAIAFVKTAGVLMLCLGLVACGGNRGGFFSGDRAGAQHTAESEILAERERATGTTSSLWDLFVRRDPGTEVAVNRYLWNAALEVLDFLPIETIDPFSGVIVTGFGVPPGGGQAYRATVHISDAALDARALKLALMTRAGPADPATVRALEDAILSRARQLRIRDRRL